MFGDGDDPAIVGPTSGIWFSKMRGWKAARLNFDSDIALAEKLNGRELSATDPNLNEFFAGGGKVILYHGLTDPIIAPQNTIDYYGGVLVESGARAEASVRLFLAPGMDHCSGGVGPSTFDARKSLVDWVEHGRP
jgi:feruloyl esterase